MSHSTLSVRFDNRLYCRLLDLARKRELEPGTLAAQAVVEYLRSQDAVTTALLENKADLERWEDESPTPLLARSGHRWPG